MTSVKHRLQKLGTGLGDLAERSMKLWLDVGLDPLGGAYGFLDRRHRPVFGGDARGPSGEVCGDQSLVQQARHLYSYSLYAERRQAEPRAAAFAHRLYAHLCHAFDSGDVFVHQRSRDGVVRSDAVQLYAQGFAVFALATYGRVLAVPAARERALALFEYLDARLHDAQHGGYDQQGDGGWLSFVSAPNGAAKCSNTHLHTLEATTALLRAWPSQKLARARTLELALLIATRLCQPAGNLHPFFDREWRPVGPPRVSYGHDVETAWLLLDALEVLSESGEVPFEVATSVRQAAKALVMHMLRTGWDPAGGVFDHGVPEGAPEPARVLARAKVWWAQVEALPGLYRIHRLTQDEALVERMEQTLEFLRTRLWDQEFGGYFWDVDDEGRPLRGDHKGELWKTPYHDVRACLFTADWIAEDLSAGEGVSRAPTRRQGRSSAPR